VRWLFGYFYKETKTEQTMRVLVCLDGTNGVQVSKATEILSAVQPLILGMLYVTDSGPRRDIEHTRERFLRRLGPPRARVDEMEQAELAAAQDVLNEGLRYLPNAETFQRQGRPEREIVNFAAEWQADLVVICPRGEYGAKPTIGPRSVGHVARFVLDHAPCPVLLVRQLAPEQFPIAR
jgi:nucleotide-binding universal stress UspA family protein